MDKRRDDIEKYLNGELTAAEMYALEKEALSDPFLAEALEGAASISAVDFSKDIAELNQKIIKRKPTTGIWSVRIAASVVLIAVSIFITWIAIKEDPKQDLAFEKPITIPGTLPTPESTPPVISTPEKSKEEISTISQQQTSSPSSPKHTKKSSPSENEELIKQTPEPLVSETTSTDKVSTPLTENKDTEQPQYVILNPNKKNDLQPPSAAEIRMAEGYIASVDARPTIVTGQVMSAEDGTPLPNVSVTLKGTSIITKTDAHGRYAITGSSESKTLIYSSEGLESTEVKINGIDSTYLPVKIEMTEEALKEAAVESNYIDEFGPTNVYTIPAHPETGNRAFKQYLQKTYKYPQQAKETKVEGTVVIEFKVDATGGLSEFRIVRGIGNGCDEEIIRLILQGVKWIPTKKDGIPVNDKARVKFKFELGE